MERSQLLERLCALRALYALRGNDDRRSVVSIDEAIALADALLDGDAEMPAPLSGATRA